MRYGSVCSGIEAATVAWHPLGWRPSFLSEIEKFPRAVLAHHYPEVPLHGDFTTIQEAEYDPIDLLVGGTPCQSFSVCGLGGGLADERGNLALEYLRLAQRLRPRWVVWENVPGVLSTNGGRDFGSILGGLVELGYGFAYRVFDAQYFGVAQRRRRVFVVGCAGDWRAAAAVLFERHSLQGHPPPRRETGERIAPGLSASAGGISGKDAQDGRLIASTGDVSHCLNAGGMKRIDYETETLVAQAFAMRGRDGGAMPEVSGDSVSALRAASGGSTRDYLAMMPEVADPITSTEGKAYTHEGANNFRLHNVVPHIQQTSAVRRLTPRECERLQGFPEIENTLRVLVCKSEDEKRARALSAQRSSQVQWPDQSGPVAVNVLIDLERQVLQLHSLGRSPWSASIAEFASSCRPSMRPDAFAHLAALTHSTVGQATRNGGAGSQPLTRPSTQALNGSASALLCGQEIAALASDAERFTAVLNQCLKSTTSQAGRDSESFGSTLETLACCVSTAISGFIPDAIRDACSYELRLTTHCGYTAITHRKKAATDGPRYKALGNSMAVPVMRWIGERIQMVEAIT